MENKEYNNSKVQFRKRLLIKKKKRKKKATYADIVNIPSVKVIKPEKSKYIPIHGIYTATNSYINLYCSIVKEHHIALSTLIIFLFVR